MSRTLLHELISLTHQHVSALSTTQKKLVVSRESAAYFQAFAQTPSYKSTADTAPLQPLAAPPKMQISAKQPLPAPIKKIEAPKAPPAPEKPPEPTTFTQEKVVVTSSQDFADIRAILTTHFPAFRIIDKTPLPQELAKPQATASIVIRAAARTEEECAFVDKVASYLRNARIAPTIINSCTEDTPLHTPAHGNNTPFLNLGEVSRFLNDVGLKVKLRNHLKSLFPHNL